MRVAPLPSRLRLGTTVAMALGLLGAMTFPGAPRAVAAVYSAGNTETVESRDDFFDPEAVHVPAGTVVEWPNEGRNAHTVTADDGSFDSGNLPPGAEFRLSFPKSGAYRYYCRYHGRPGGLGMAGVILVGNATLPSPSGGQVGPGREPVPSGPGSTRLVPSKYPTIQRAADAAKPGDLVLVGPGVYPEAVEVTTPYLTIRGTDRNSVILEGGFRRANGIHVIEADGVAIENMTARHYQLNGFYWTTVFGYRGSYLTAFDNGDYGVYAFDSVFGRFDHSYAGGHPDSGFYIGQCHPCHAVITDVLSENNALGYSGTNAGGDLRIVNSVWRRNMSGVVPNTLDTERLAPQRGITISGNVVEDNNNLGAPAKTQQYPSIGTGILLAGGVDNLVENNVVEDHKNYGIAVLPNIDKHFWIPQGNVVRGNHVRGSGRADLALAGPAGQGNCFSGNDFTTSLPPAIQVIHGCGFALNRLGGGDLSAAIQTLALFIRAQSGKYPHGDWHTMPAPQPQTTMPRTCSLEHESVFGTVSCPTPLAVPGVNVPGNRETRPLALVPKKVSRHQEVNVLGISIFAAPTWWSLLLATYAYLLPLILYVAWVSIAMWDLVRQEEVGDARRIGWMAVVLLVPLLGPILYYVIGRSPIPRSLRTVLVAGGLGVYVVIAVLAILIGGS
jgi:plastocyanin